MEESKRIDKQTQQVLSNTLSDSVLDLIAPVDFNDPDKLLSEKDLAELAKEGYLF